MDFNSLEDLLDEQRCYELVRKLKWGDSNLDCPSCASKDIRKNGHDTGNTYRQRYICKDCERSFTDLTDTIFSNSHVPLQKWMLCYFLKDHMSNKQMANALSLSTDTVGDMRVAISGGISRGTVIKSWH